MSRTTRLTLVVSALLSVCAALSSSAAAVTWHNTGNTGFVATGGPFTLSRGSVNLSCNGSAATGNAPGGSTVATHYSMTGTSTWSPCTLAGQPTSVSCSYTFTGAGFAAGVTSGSMILTCVARLTASGTNVCHIAGSTVASYTNTGWIADAKFTLPASASLTTTNSTAACPLGVGAAGLTENTITVTSGVGGSGDDGPIINRTS